MLANDLSTMLPEIQNVLDRFTLGATAYNKQFDFGFLKSRSLRIKELPCIMLTAAPVVNLPPNPWFSDPKWPKVEEAWEYFFPDEEYKAHMYFNIASANGLEDGKSRRNILEKKMNLEQIAKAQTLAREWMEKHQK